MLYSTAIAKHFIDFILAIKRKDNQRSGVVHVGAIHQQGKYRAHLLATVGDFSTAPGVQIGDHPEVRAANFEPLLFRGVHARCTYRNKRSHHKESKILRMTHENSPEPELSASVPRRVAMGNRNIRARMVEKCAATLLF